MQRIAMVSVHTGPLATLGGKETGGMNVYIRDLSRALSRKGIDVDVYTRLQDPTIAPIDKRLAERGRVFYVKAGPERPYNKNEIYHHIDEFVENVLALQQSYDIIYSHYWLSGIASGALRHYWQIPYVQMFHTLAELKNRVAQSPAERDTLQRLNCEGEIMRSADRIIAATPLDRNHMMWAYGAPSNKIEVVPPGVDLERFKPIDRQAAKACIDVPAHHKMILFVGRMQPLKGIDTILRALAIAKQREPELLKNVCLSIVGGDPNQDSELEMKEFERLKDLRESLNIGDLVTFLGAKDQDKLVYYYTAAEMVVMPSHYESFGMVAIEAMACGTPVIASDVGGLSFSIEDGFNGFLVPGRDATALAGKVILLLKHSILRDQLGEQARQWVQRYSWDNIADELLSVFEDTVEEYQRIKALQ
ncbi:MAG: glycosyltransferase [Anaerolineae bacterium]|nr:glycosyltransferase [Anaerolineae bacterium]